MVLPLLFLFFLGILELGRAWNLYQVATDAAREGARYSVAPAPGTDTLPGPATVEAQVNQWLSSAAIDPATAVVSVNQAVPVTYNGVTTEDSEVDVTLPWSPQSLMMQQVLQSALGSTTVQLTAKAVMRNETN